MVCDFCGEPNPAWAYPAKSFRSVVGESVGGWAACDDCHTLIEADLWADLVVRVIHANSYESATGWVADFLFDIYDKFRANRTGPARRL